MTLLRFVLPGILVLFTSGLSGCHASSSCGVIEILPATVNVTTTTGAPICNAVVTLAAGADASDVSIGFACTGSSGPSTAGCPASADASSCTIVLDATEAGDTTPFTIRVSAPGYVSQAVANVNAGVSGCTPTIEASHVTVVLMPD